MKERANPWAKRLDFLLGIPLLFLLAPFRRRPPSLPVPLRRIALLKSSAIGDTVILSAIVQDLENAFPSCEIVVFAGNSNLKAAQVFFGARARLLPMLNPLKALATIRADSFDVLIDCDSWPRINALLAFFARASFTIGFRTEGQGRHFAYGIAIPHSKKIHELENYRNLIRALGAQPAALPKLVAAGNPDPSLANTILLHPWPGGSRAAEKMWPRDHWLELATRLARAGYTVRLTAGPADREKAKDLAASAASGTLAVLNTPSLEVLLRSLADALLVVTVDTGIAHLSGALGQSTLVLHGPTSPERWGALGPKVMFLKDSQQPLIHLGFEKPAGDGVSLSVDEVSDGIHTILRGKSPRDSS